MRRIANVFGAGLVAFSTMLVLAAASQGAAPAANLSGTFYYTLIGSPVKKANYSYDGTTFAVSNQTEIATLPGGDGIIGAPDGSKPHEVLKRPYWLREVENQVR